jgi:hypothetical protein
MKLLFTMFAAALFSVGAIACGSASKGTVTAPRTSSHTSTASATQTTISSGTTTPDYTKTDRDKDNDIRSPYDDTNNNSLLKFGSAANTSDRRAITALLKRYYAAATTQDGAKACSMIYSTLAEAVPEDYGVSPPGPPYMRGTTCPRVITLLFKHFHDQVVADNAALKVTQVRLNDRQGLALLSFGTMPERQIHLTREGHIWKIASLLDSELP